MNVKINLAKTPAVRFNTPMKEIVYIYGFKTKEGKIAYVGQTLDPVKREWGHRNSSGSYTANHIKDCEFVILKETDFESAGSVEGEEIRKRWLIGECWLNKASNKKPSKAKSPGFPVYWVEGDMRFRSRHHASRSLNIPITSVCHRLSGKTPMGKFTLVEWE